MKTIAQQLLKYQPAKYHEIFDVGALRDFYPTLEISIFNDGSVIMQRFSYSSIEERFAYLSVTDCLNQFKFSASEHEEEAKEWLAMGNKRKNGWSWRIQCYNN